MKVVVFSKAEFEPIAANAHLVCFGETTPKDFDRYDYALIVEDENGTPLCYSTIRELDADSCYMKHGGAFPSSKGTINSFLSYEKMIDFLKNKYKNINTLIENKNTPMIKFAMKVGFLVTGVRNFKGCVLVEFSCE